MDVRVHAAAASLLCLLVNSLSGQENNMFTNPAIETGNRQAQFDATRKLVVAFPESVELAVRHAESAIELAKLSSDHNLFHRTLQVLDSIPPTRETALVRIRVHIALHEFQAARQIVQDFFGDDPNHVAIWELNVHQGRYDELQAKLRHADDARLPDRKFNYALACYALGRLPEALEYLHQYSKTLGDSAHTGSRLHLIRAVVYLDGGLPDQARREVLQARAIMPSSQASALMLRLARDERERQQAVSELASACQANTIDFGSMVDLASACKHDQASVVEYIRARVFETEKSLGDHESFALARYYLDVELTPHRAIEFARENFRERQRVADQLLLARALRADGRANEAIQLIDAALHSGGFISDERLYEISQAFTESFELNQLIRSHREKNLQTKIDLEARILP